MCTCSSPIRVVFILVLFSTLTVGQREGFTSLLNLSINKSFLKAKLNKPFVRCPKKCFNFKPRCLLFKTSIHRDVRSIVLVPKQIAAFPLLTQQM